MIGLAYLGCSILSFFWILLMRCFAGIMVWTSIALVFLLVTGLLGYSTYRYGLNTIKINESRCFVCIVDLYIKCINTFLQLLEIADLFLTLTSANCLCKQLSLAISKLPILLFCLRKAIDGEMMAVFKVLKSILLGPCVPV